MPNQWLAIDVATAPAKRAREVRVAWERFISGARKQFDDGDAGQTKSIRAPIAASWRRSAAAGVDPSGLRIAPVVADADETTARWEVHPLAEMAPLIRSCLAASADESRHLIVVSDANGVLLWVEGNARVRLQAADSMNFAEGTLWSEGGAGTNAIGTALAAEHAVQVFASEHFNEVVQQWTCAAAPVHDPDTGQVIGVIDLTGEMATVHPHSMAVATATATGRGGAAALPDARPRRPACWPATAAGWSTERSRARWCARAGAWSPASRWAGSPWNASRCPRAAASWRSATTTRSSAEALGCEEAYLVRAVPTAAPRGRRGPVARPASPRARARRGRARRQAAGAAAAPQRDRHLAVRESGWADQRGAERGRVRPRRPGRQHPGRDLPPAQAAGRLHRVRALPLQMRGQQRRVDRSAGCCTAARYARPRPVTRGRCCRSPTRPVSWTSASSSSAGCVSR